MDTTIISMQLQQLRPPQFKHLHKLNILRRHKFHMQRQQCSSIHKFTQQ